MDDIVIRPPAADELTRVSRQIAESYKAAYQGMMRQEYLDSLTEDHWVPILRDGLERGDTCLIAEATDEIAGSVVYGRSAVEPEGADWHAIYLSPGFIGKGLGHRLCAEMEETMRGQGFRSSALEVLTSNQRAIKFYLDHGYKVSDTFTVAENGMELECHTMKKQL